MGVDGLPRPVPKRLVERREEPDFRARFRDQSDIGRLDWPPRFDLNRQVRIYDPDDRSRYLAGEAYPTENIRRRSAEEVLKAQKYGVERMADALVAVKDSLDAALKVDSPSVDAYKQGVELTARQLASVFEKFSILEVDPIGQKFDPNRHQAIANIESSQEPNTVVSVMQKGYTLHERVLRPALVAVAKAKES